jgi:hypothetical protein
VGGLKIEDVVTIQKESVDCAYFKHLTHTLPMRSAEAHCFREMCLCIVANYPELLCQLHGEDVMAITHKLEDQHHFFAVMNTEPRQVEHVWGATSTTLPCTAGGGVPARPTGTGFGSSAELRQHSPTSVVESDAASMGRKATMEADSTGLQGLDESEARPACGEGPSRKTVQGISVGGCDSGQAEMATHTAYGGGIALHDAERHEMGT